MDRHTEDAAWLARAYEAHSRMVYNVCLRMLADPQAAEDASQAVFLLLLQKASALRESAQLAAWLYRTAEWTARNGRRAAGRRRRWEKEASSMASPNQTGEPGSERDWSEIRPELDRALMQLPERYRLPVVLVYLEGLQQKQAAAALGLPEGTLRWRLAEALERLRRKLAKRKKELTVLALAATLPAHAGEAAPPASLLPSLLAAAQGISAGAGSAAVSSSVQLYLEGAMQAIFWFKVKVAVAVIVVLAVGGGIPFLQHCLKAEEDGPAEAPAVAPAVLPAPVPVAKEGLATPEEIAKTAFPGHGVLLAVQLDAVTPVRMGQLEGCKIRLRVTRVLRLDGGKEDIKFKQGNPFNLEQTLQLLGARKDDRIVSYIRYHYRNDEFLAAYLEEDDRLQKRLEQGKTFLLVLQSALQLSPIPAPPGAQNMPWCQFEDDEQGLLLLEYDATAMRDLPARLDAVRGWIRDLGADDRAKRSAALAKLVENRDLAEPLLLRLPSDPNAQAAVAQALAKLGNPRAVGPLTADVNATDPLAACEAIVALRELKGWTFGTVGKLVAKLDDTAERRVGLRRFVLSQEAAKTLECLTGKSFGTDRTKWDVWLRETAAERQKQEELRAGRKGGG